MVYFLQDWIVSPVLNLLKRTMTYPGFAPGTLGFTVSIPTRYELIDQFKNITVTSLCHNLLYFDILFIFEILMGQLLVHRKCSLNFNLLYFDIFFKSIYLCKKSHSFHSLIRFFVCEIIKMNNEKKTEI
jgi:hypothetical protein